LATSTSNFLGVVSMFRYTVMLSFVERLRGVALRFFRGGLLQIV
jgi:hypothetical protein